MMMIPEAWQKHETMPENKRAFYEYHSCLMEPWDGPASIAFTDGHYIGAVLDRNGLRPSRYYLTHDDRVIMASEVGVLPVDPASVMAKGRLQPGRMFLIDFEQGRLVTDEELKNELADRRPYAKWLRENRIELSDLRPGKEPHRFDPGTLMRTDAGVRLHGRDDAVHAATAVHRAARPGRLDGQRRGAGVSERPAADVLRLLQAALCPGHESGHRLDPRRSDHVAGVLHRPGAEPAGNIAEHSCRLLVPHPILTNEELAALKHMDHRGWRTQTIDITFPRSQGEAGLSKTLDRICAEAEQAIDDGYSADHPFRPQAGPAAGCRSARCWPAAPCTITWCARPNVRGSASCWRRAKRAKCIITACWSATGPTPSIRTWRSRRSGPRGVTAAFRPRSSPTTKKLSPRYRKGVAKGMLKVMAKMGISTLQSYKGAQIFEALGLQDEIIERCFTGTASRVQGVSFEVLAARRSSATRAGIRSA